MSDVMDELGAGDRATLRAWRISNLLGWGLAGALVAVIAAIVGARAVVGFAGTFRFSTLAPLVLTVSLVVVGLLIVPVPAGLVVGAHVYRWPGWIGAASVSVPTGAWLLLSRPWDLAQLAVALVIGALMAIVAGVVARARFGRRPRALRAPAAR